MKTTGEMLFSKKRKEMLVTRNYPRGGGLSIMAIKEGRKTW